MDNLSKNYYQAYYEKELLGTYGSEFETLFQRIMKSIYQQDFINVIPYGKQGDQKCDGILLNARKLFQVYAPAQPNQQELCKKLQVDFEGAVQYWGADFDTWVFVYKHYFGDGVPPDVLHLIQSLKKSTSKQIEVWSKAECSQLFHELPKIALKEWYGDMPDRSTTFGFTDLKPLFNHLTNYEADIKMTITPFIGDKISANLFNQATAEIIKNSMSKVDKVSEYLRVCSDIELGERARTAFADKYQSFKSQGLDANQMFFLFEEWLADGHLTPANQRQAISTLITYFFEKCDIFESPRG